MDMKWFLAEDNNDSVSYMELKAKDVNEAINAMQKVWNSLHPHDQKGMFSFGVFLAPTDEDGNPDYERNVQEVFLVLNSELLMHYTVDAEITDNGAKRTERLDSGNTNEFFDVCDYMDEPGVNINTDDFDEMEVTISFYTEGADEKTVRPIKQCWDTILGRDQ